MKTELRWPILAFAIILALMLLIPYEWYFSKVEHWPKGHDPISLDLWAEWRGRVDQLTEEDIVILGSSRAHFDLNVHLWDSLTGRKPIMLAFPGSSPYHTVEDLIDNTRFNGLLVIGVSPGLFFSHEGSWGANEGKKLVDHYKRQTYAGKFNAQLIKMVDPAFSFTQTDLGITYLLERIRLPNRDSVMDPPIWPPMVNMDRFRSVRMIAEMETDTLLQRKQKDIWFSPNPQNRSKDSLAQILRHYSGLVKKFKARGGRVAFIRPPVTGFYLETEARLYPRSDFWDPLLRESGVPGYHYQDYPTTRGMNPPEWSHLNRQESDIYTRVIVGLLMSDNLL